MHALFDLAFYVGHIKKVKAHLVTGKGTKGGGRYFSQHVVV